MVSAAWGEEGGLFGAAGHCGHRPTVTMDQCGQSDGHLVSLPGLPDVTRSFSSLPKLRLTR